MMGSLEAGEEGFPVVDDGVRRKIGRLTARQGGIVEVDGVGKCLPAQVPVPLVCADEDILNGLYNILCVHSSDLCVVNVIFFKLPTLKAA